MKLWERYSFLKSTHGKHKYTPEELWDAAVEYFRWVEANPLAEEKLFSYQGDLTKGKINKMRAMTYDGLSTFLGMTLIAWNQLRDKEEYAEVCAAIQQVIREQKFTGAAAELLNPLIISRDLGLKDTTAHEVTSPDGSMSPRDKMTDEELAKELERRGIPSRLLEE